MEPNKIEKQFRDKLNAREIQPSAQAWDRLDAMLSVTEEKKTRKPFGFLFIAASILVFATLGLFFFNQNGTEINTTNSVVGTETKIDTTQNKKKSINGNMGIDNDGLEGFDVQVKKSQKLNEAVATLNDQLGTDNQQPKTKESIINQKTNNNQNQIIKDKEIEFQNPSDIAIKDMPRIQDKKDIYVKIDNTKKVFSNPNRDELLLADLDKVSKQSTDSKSNIKVDAKSLLSQVDGEVEHSFREKMFKKINKNYQEVKVALANRNNE